MKTIKLTILFLYLTNLSFAQEFKIDNSLLLWTKVVNEPITPDEAAVLLSNFNGEVIAKTDNQVVYHIKKQKFPYKKYGGTALSTPYYIATPLNAKATIYIKPDKYKINITELTYTFQSVLMGGGVSSEIPMERAIVKRDKINFRNRKVNKWIRHLSDYFDKSTSPKDW